MVGQSLGHYKILDKLGEGGIGQVGGKAQRSCLIGRALADHLPVVG